MLLKCEVLGICDSEKATKLLTEAVEKIIKNGGIVPRKLTLKELQEIKCKEEQYERINQH